MLPPGPSNEEQWLTSESNGKRVARMSATFALVPTGKLRMKSQAEWTSSLLRQAKCCWVARQSEFTLSTSTVSSAKISSDWRTLFAASNIWPWIGFGKTSSTATHPGASTTIKGLPQCFRLDRWGKGDRTVLSVIAVMILMAGGSSNECSINVICKPPLSWKQEKPCRPLKDFTYWKSFGGLQGLSHFSLKWEKEAQQTTVQFSISDLVMWSAGPLSSFLNLARGGRIVSAGRPDTTLWGRNCSRPCPLCICLSTYPTSRIKGYEKVSTSALMTWSL